MNQRGSVFTTEMQCWTPRLTSTKPKPPTTLPECICAAKRNVCFAMWNVCELRKWRMVYYQNWNIRRQRRLNSCFEMMELLKNQRLFKYTSGAGVGISICFKIQILRSSLWLNISANELILYQVNRESKFIRQILEILTESHVMGVRGGSHLSRYRQWFWAEHDWFSEKKNLLEENCK